MYEVVVQNSILKGLLQDNIKTYPGVTFAAKDVSFKTPFEPFFHSWDKIENAAKEYSDDDPAPYLKRLVEVLENEMEYSIKSRRDNVSHLVITFDLLWTIFKPGDIVFMDDADQARMYQLVSTSYDEERTRFRLTCRYIDWDGTDFGYDYYYQSIQKFDGPQLIHRLIIYPKMYVENLDEVEKTMRDRGRRFCLLSGPDYKYESYKGPAQRPRSFYDFSAGEAQEYVS